MGLHNKSVVREFSENINTGPADTLSQFDIINVSTRGIGESVHLILLALRHELIKKAALCGEGDGV